ncbi:hypothetical protein M413DRAFT_29528 [Hebeloma cylindrosporum]|uniref:Uncharacterized protein n=1 Tax=Hebeloma cylindrosporum TaxID=76867 RepID=A0A0C2XNY5_HEBCY|nr:hypothetical protein M413DRAFT_29528 [Hebeloma cylindrosporum h7]
MRQTRFAKFALPPLDLTKASLASATLEKENTLSDSIQRGFRSVEIGYFPHLIRSTGTRTPSSSRLISHNEARNFPASASAATGQNFIQKDTVYTGDYIKPLPSPEKRKKHICGHEQLEVLRKKLEPYQEAIQDDDSLIIVHAKTGHPETPHTKSLVPIPPPPYRKINEETANAEPFSTTPIFSFSVDETWDGMSETSLVYEGQVIPVDLTLDENAVELGEDCYLYEFMGPQIVEE